MDRQQVEPVALGNAVAATLLHQGAARLLENVLPSR
jgi:hypothetical protein